jgi:hypothetical protein
MQLLDYFKEKRNKEKILEYEGGSSGSHSLENSLWKHTDLLRDRLRNECRKARFSFRRHQSKISTGTAVSAGCKEKELC